MHQCIPILNAILVVSSPLAVSYFLDENFEYFLLNVIAGCRSLVYWIKHLSILLHILLVCLSSNSNLSMMMKHVCIVWNWFKYPSGWYFIERLLNQQNSFFSLCCHHYIPLDSVICITLQANWLWIILWADADHTVCFYVFFSLSRPWWFWCFSVPGTQCVDGHHVYLTTFWLTIWSDDIVAVVFIESFWFRPTDCNR